VIVATSWLPSCKKESKEVCTDLGRDGGVLQSYDTVLTIAVQPEALDQTDRFCIVATDDVPPLFGEAYRVTPSLRLNFDAIVSYRGTLPDDLGDTNIGRVSQRDFEMGKGRWESLESCHIDAEVRHVECPDRELSRFYGLMDKYVGMDTIASDTLETTDGSGATTSMTGIDTMTTMDPETGAETGPMGIEYPPSCAEAIDETYELVELGQVFIETADGGAEDLAPDGQGGFVVRMGDGLGRLDVTGATFGTADGFTVSDLLDSPTFSEPTLGLRYGPGNELVMAQTNGELVAMSFDGSLRTIADGIGLPNGVSVGTDGIAFYTDFTNNDIFRVSVADGGPTMVAVLSQPNGIYYDRLREILFYVGFDSGTLWRLPVTATGEAGEAEMVARVGGNPDGLGLDECGNLYIVDNNGGSDARLLRVAMDDDGEMSALDELVTGIGGGVANGAFGTGRAYGDFSTSIFLTGVPGEVSYVDVHRAGAEVPRLDAPPPTEGGGTDTGGSSSDGGASTSTSSTGTSSSGG
jgi:hypothetical protein